jgi:phage-related protein
MEVFPTTNRDYYVIKTPMFSTTVISYGGKTEQRISDGPSRYKFKIAFWDKVLEADGIAILNFFLARQGQRQAFRWTNPDDGVNYVVRFALDANDFDQFFTELTTVGQLELIETAFYTPLPYAHQVTFIGAAFANFAGVGPMVYAFNAGTGSDRLLFLAITHTTSGTITAVTYGGHACTYYDNCINSPNIVEIWYLVNPSSGVNNLSVSWTGTPGGGVGMAAFGSVDQDIPLGTPVKSIISLPSTNWTIVVPVPSKGAAQDVFATAGSPSGGGTQIQDWITGGVTPNSIGSYTVTSGQQSFWPGGVTYGASNVHVGVPINPLLG